jgi:hypothetical protein
MQELPTGGQFRFQVAPSGLVTFATDTRSFETVEEVPIQYQRAAKLISERLNRKAIQAATDEPDDVLFCGIATRNEGVSYDWDSLPAFVGTDVWSASKGRFLSPDATVNVFDEVGLPTVPAIDKEVPAAHTDFTQFEDPAAFPPSEWGEGKAAGILIRDKSGGRTAAWRVDPSSVPSTSEQRSVTDLAAAYATPDRIEQTATALRDSDHSLTVAAIRDRLIADVARELYADLFSDGEFVVSVAAFRSAVAERIQQHRSTGE